MRENFKLKTMPLLAGAVVILGGSSAFAQTLLLDRGLPTANLNNVAGTNRSNVAWADQEPVGTAPFNPGDSFSLAQAATVTDIRVWQVGGSTSGLSLLGGLGSGSIGSISSTYTAQSVTYAGGAIYQATGGSMLPIYQLDFAVNLSLTAGQNYDFFLDGGTGSQLSPFLHASNAGLSGSPQQGSDGTFLFYDPASSTVLTWDSGTGAGTYAPGVRGWDKNSDGNVQVFGTVPDGGTTMLLLGSSLAALAWLRRKM